MPGLRIRDAKPADLAALSEIESRSFAADRLSRRSFRRLINRPSACLRVAVMDGAVAGYHLVLTRVGSSLARLYSIAVAAHARGQGIGEGLLADAEHRARRAGADVLRLEVRADNGGAIRLYAGRGFARFGTYRGYYADGADALRFEKRLRRTTRRDAAGGKSRADSEEDRSPADFGIFPRVMKLSRSAAPGCPASAGGHAALPAFQSRDLANG